MINIHLIAHKPPRPATIAVRALPAAADRTSNATGIAAIKKASVETEAIAAQVWLNFLVIVEDMEGAVEAGLKAAQ